MCINCTDQHTLTTIWLCLPRSKSEKRPCVLTAERVRRRAEPAGLTDTLTAAIKLLDI